jgi:DNA repair photolyase
MVEVLKLEDIKKMQFEDFLLELNPNGLLQEQEKEQLKQFAAALAQNGAMSVSNYIKMLQIDNKTQMYNYFEKVEKEKQIREEQLQQAQMEAQMAQTEMQQQGKQNVAEINAEAGLAKQEMQQMPPQMLEQM